MGSITLRDCLNGAGSNQKMISKSGLLISLWEKVTSLRLSKSTKGIYAWYLTEARNLDGKITRFSYKISEGRHVYLAGVSYGGWGERPNYQVSFRLEPIPTPYVSYESSERSVDGRKGCLNYCFSSQPEWSISKTVCVSLDFIRIRWVRRHSI